ncbi:uncharacterized protein F5147DRAFT_773855 [Suillus discolor]|uniref:Uncharacterized protein n=1 Tax=Suillus discolor TaxID=1912936 RepID=A0A9P7F607_9AGAM|nr:uncharacterized protein F5147DRAFT_773855 [Suillus discolor]KAG2108272.1 hypothetical protein F5147DRAFT_773855 [Suillus discolor]
MLFILSVAPQFVIVVFLPPWAFTIDDGDHCFIMVFSPQWAYSIDDSSHHSLLRCLTHIV